MNETEKINTRNALMSSARKLFTEKGYRAVSTRELAEEAGVNLGAIQYHFGSKAKLFIATIKDLMRERFKNLIENQSPATDRVDAARKLHRFISSHVRENCNPEGPDISKMMCRELNSSTAQDPELCAPLVSSLVEDFIKPNDEYVANLLRVIDPDASPEQIKLSVQSVIGQCTFYVTHSLILSELRGYCPTSQEHITTTVNHITEFTLKALGFRSEEISNILNGSNGE